VGGALVLLSLGLATTVGSCGRPFSGASVVRGWAAAQGDDCAEKTSLELIPGSVDTHGPVKTCRLKVEWVGVLGVSPEIKRAVYIASLAIAFAAVLFAAIPGWLRYAATGGAARWLLVGSGALASYAWVDASFALLDFIPAMKSVDPTLLTASLTIYWVALISLWAFRPVFLRFHLLHVIAAAVAVVILAIPVRLWGYVSHLVGLTLILLGTLSARRPLG
jgi:hypothetical protein